MITLIDLLYLLRQRRDGEYIDLDTFQLTTEKGENYIEELYTFGSEERIGELLDTIEHYNIGLDHFQRVIDGDYWATPYGYQKDAIDCFNKLFEREIKGGVLSFKMGLGKTITTLSLIEKGCFNKTLIVCEKSNMKTWANEIEKHVGGVFSYVILHSDHVKKPKTVDIEPYDIIITTFDFLAKDFGYSGPKKKGEKKKGKHSGIIKCLKVQIAQIGGAKDVPGVKTELELLEHNEEAAKDEDIPHWRKHRYIKNADIEHSHGPLFNREWDLIVVDEVAKVVNRVTRASQALAAIVAKRYMVLSGTPVINYAKDLFSIFRFLGLDIHHTKFKKDYFETHKLIEHIYQKDYKDVGMVLPELKENIVSVTLNTLEREGVMLLKKELLDVYRLQQQKDVAYMAVGKLFAQMRMYLDSPNLLTAGTADVSYIPRGEVREMIFDRDYVSSKSESILETAEKLKGKRILVFSAYVTYLKQLLGLFREKFPDGKYDLFSGDTPTARRGQMIDSINKGEIDAMFCQIDTISSGGNIQGANVIFLLEPAYNVATEKQAVARAHRIGQKHEVQVFRFIVKDSLEYHIQSIQKKKEDDKVAFLGGENEVEMKISEEQIKWLLGGKF